MIITLRAFFEPKMTDQLSVDGVRIGRVLSVEPDTEIKHSNAFTVIAEIDEAWGPKFAQPIPISALIGPERKDR